MIKYALFEIPTITDNGKGLPVEDIQMIISDPEYTVRKRFLLSDLTEQEQYIVANFLSLMRTRLSDGVPKLEVKQTELTVSLKESTIVDKGVQKTLSVAEMKIIVQALPTDFIKTPHYEVFEAQFADFITDDEIVRLSKVGLDVKKGSTWAEMYLNTAPKSPVRMQFGSEYFGAKEIVIK